MSDVHLLYDARFPDAFPARHPLLPHGDVRRACDVQDDRDVPLRDDVPFHFRGPVLHDVQDGRGVLFLCDVRFPDGLPCCFQRCFCGVPDEGDAPCAGAVLFRWCFLPDSNVELS